MIQFRKSATAVLIINFAFSTTGAFNYSKQSATTPIRSLSFAPQLFEKLKKRCGRIAMKNHNQCGKYRNIKSDKLYMTIVNSV